MVCRLPHLLSHARLMIADAPLFCKACIEFVTLLSGLHDAKQLSLSYSICAGGVPGKSHRSPFDLPSEASFVLPTPLSKQKPSKMIVKMRELISTPPEKSLHASNLGWAVRSCVAEMDSLECESEIPARVVVVVHDSFSRVDDALAPGLDNPTNTVQLIRINVSDEQKPPSESDETMRTSGLADGSGDDNDDDAAAALSFSQSTAPSAQRNIVMEPEEDCFGKVAAVLVSGAVALCPSVCRLPLIITVPTGLPPIARNYLKQTRGRDDNDRQSPLPLDDYLRPGSRLGPCRANTSARHRQ